MPLMFSLPLREEMKFARLIGGGDFDRAIKLLTDGLAKATSDVNRLDFMERIALCHWGASRADDAIESLNKALEIDPKSFFSLKLLSECHAMRNEHDAAATFARRAMEAYPDPLPQPPKLVPRLLRGLARIVPKYRSLFLDIEKQVADPDCGDPKWYAWAKDYLKWYDASRGTSIAPRLH